MKADLRAIHGAADAPVSKPQIKRLACAAQEAFRLQRKLNLWDGDFDTFRHAAAFEATAGRETSFRLLRQRDFLPVLARFAELAGSDRRAVMAEARRPGDDRRRALGKLAEAEAEFAEAFGDELGARRYADTLLARIHRTDRHRATARQIWQAFFTLRTRGRALERKHAQDALGEAGACFRHPDAPEGSEAPSPRFPPPLRAS